MIEHCPAPEVTLSEMRRLAKKNGLIYLTTPNRLGLGWVFSDPHYNLPLVSLLPKPAGNFLVKKFRGLDNDVIRLFNHMEIEKIFSETGLEVIYSYPDEVLGKLQNPEQIASPVKKKIFSALELLRLKSLIKPMLPALHFFSTTLIYILRPKA